MAESSPSTDEFLNRAASLRIPHPLECLNVSVSTACSLECRFCAYRHSRIPRRSMPDSLFQSCIERAVRFGHRTFNLTPIVGEVLLDPSFLNKLVYLDNHPGVKFYFFSSNLTRADDEFFATLRKLGKLRWLSISLYGLNPQDYQKITGASEGVFADVVRNLQKLSCLPSLAGRCEVKVRGPGPRSASTPLPECVEIINRLESQRIQVRNGVRIMNWGGLIKKRDMAELDMDFKQAERHRTRPCVFLFHKPNILPDGTVNACSCGDAHAELNIGNLVEERFADIFSSANERYLRILHGQMAGRFGAPCGGCSGYRPLDQNWYSYHYYDREFIPPREFFEWLSNNAM